MALWHDRRGRFSPQRAATLALLLAPGIALVWFALTHNLGPRPRTEAIHEVGLWAIRFLMLSLFVTPMRRIARYAPLVDVRRLLGVGCFAYIVLHFSLYITDQMFDLSKVASEIALRYYLTIGFSAWLGLATLAITSNGIFIWLILYRLLHWKFPRNTEFPIAVIAALWLGVGAFVFLAEAVGFWIAFHAPVWRVLVLDFDFRAGIRPGWYVWGVGLLVTAIAVLRAKPSDSWLPFVTRRATAG